MRRAGREHAAGARTGAARRRAATAAAAGLAASLAVASSAAAPAGQAPAACRATVFLTLDTGNMRHAREIAAILRRHQVRATFFLADEATWPDRAGSALDARWDGFWRELAAEGHAFGSHTWRHGRFQRDLPNGAVEYRPQFGDNAGRSETLSPEGVCREIDRVDARFRALASRPLDPFWRAPGGRTTPNALAAAAGCGWSHVGWAPAGFLGDELPSDTHPNERLLARALASIRDGDVLMAHLGIWSRAEPFAPMLDPLIAGLKDKGYCFATLRERAAARAPSAAPARPATPRSSAS